MKVAVVKLDDVLWSQDLENSRYKLALLMIDKIFFIENHTSLD